MKNIQRAEEKEDEKEEACFPNGAPCNIHKEEKASKRERKKTPKKLEMLLAGKNAQDPISSLCSIVVKPKKKIMQCFA